MHSYDARASSRLYGYFQSTVNLQVETLILLRCSVVLPLHRSVSSSKQEMVLFTMIGDELLLKRSPDENHDR